MATAFEGLHYLPKKRHWAKSLLLFSFTLSKNIVSPGSKATQCHGAAPITPSSTRRAICKPNGPFCHSGHSVPIGVNPTVCGVLDTHSRGCVCGVWCGVCGVWCVWCVCVCTRVCVCEHTSTNTVHNMKYHFYTLSMRVTSISSKQRLNKSLKETVPYLILLNSQRCLETWAI